MKEKANLIKIHGKNYLLIPDEIVEYIDESSFISTNDDKNKLTLTMNPSKKKSSREKTISDYWELAAKNNKREIFMNTVRPLLKKKLGYQYSEILCEDKAKILCKNYYEAQDRGEIYEGPYLID